MFISSPKEELDFSLLRIKPKNGQKAGEVYGYISMPETDKIKPGERINVIQHPKSRRKEVVIYENKVIRFLEDDFVHYEADTLRGSSGSPVFNKQWDLVALHHSGVFEKDANGDYVLDDGEYVYSANEGIRISKIVEFIKKQKTDSQLKQELEALIA